MLVFTLLAVNQGLQTINLLLPLAPVMEPWVLPVTRAWITTIAALI
jgi:hypothetical protein